MILTSTNRNLPHYYTENPFKCVPCEIEQYVDDNVCKNYGEEWGCSTNKFPWWDPDKQQAECYSEIPDRATLKKAIVDCIKGNTYIHSSYGPTKNWRFSPNLTDMSSLFKPESIVNDYIIYNTNTACIIHCCILQKYRKQNPISITIY